MTATLAQARDEIHELFYDAMAADTEAAAVTVLAWDTLTDVPTTSDNQQNPLPWARITVQHFGANQATLSSDVSNRRRWRRNGLVTVQIFTPFGTGLSMADRLAMIALGAYEGKDTPSGVWFRNVKSQEIGQSDSWFQTNVSAEFEYDEVK